MIKQTTTTSSARNNISININQQAVARTVWTNGFRHSSSAAAAAAACVFCCFLLPSFSRSAHFCSLCFVCCYCWKGALTLGCELVYLSMLMNAPSESEKNPGHFPTFSVLFLANFPNFPQHVVLFWAVCLPFADSIGCRSILFSLSFYPARTTWITARIDPRTFGVRAAPSLRTLWQGGKLDVLARIKLLAMILQPRNMTPTIIIVSCCCRLWSLAVVVAGWLVKNLFMIMHFCRAPPQQSAKVARLCIVGLIVKVKAMPMTDWNNWIVGSLIV